MKDLLEGFAVIVACILSIAGIFAFCEGVASPWCKRYLERCERERREQGHRKPLDRGDDGTG